MHPVFRNVLAVAAGIIIGSVLNMGLIMISGSIIPPPEGADVTTAEGMKAAIHLFEPRHFIFPFLAHALGTLAGAYLTARLAVSRKSFLANVIGIFFLLGGIAAANMIPAPNWFIVTDLFLAYLPMGWLGGRLAAKK